MNTPEQQIGTTVEVDGVEREVILTYALHKGEKQTHDYPGSPPYAELVSARYEDDGSEVAEGVICDDDIDGLGGEAAETYADNTAAAAEDAAEARAEARRERLSN